MRILVVEDDRKIANAIKKGLEQELFAVDVCFNGKEALGSGLVMEYDLIILDRMLPEIDGMEICAQLRTKNIKTPILMLTAKIKLQIGSRD